MKKSIALTALLLSLASSAMAQQAAPAAQPSTATKAVEAAGALANKALGTAPATQPAKAPLININKATAAELDALPQIGEVRSKAIVAGRPYKMAHDLVDRKIIPAAIYEGIKDKIAVK